MIRNEDNPLWVERYRPRLVADVILPKKSKQQFAAMVKKGEIPVNILMAGGPGVGKSAVAQAMLDEIGADYIALNGSLHGNIDTLRTRVSEFASSVSFSGGRKFVLINEADYLSAATQPALRQFMEDYSANCGFVLTCNWLERIIEPLRSRCSIYEFRIDQAEQAAMKKLAFERIEHVLRTERVEYDPAVVAHVLEKFFPDMRRTLNQLQSYSNGGPIDSGILARVQDASIETLVAHMRDRNFTAARAWIGEHSGEYDSVYRKLYDTAHDIVVPASVPQLVVHLGTYQYRAALAADPEVNMAACVAEVMASCAFK